jgi:hypothetical protein
MLYNLGRFTTIWLSLLKMIWSSHIPENRDGGRSENLEGEREVMWGHISHD